ncbi:MAG: polysaccharide biosynthesis protein [Sulfuricella sp.]
MDRLKISCGQQFPEAVQRVLHADIRDRLAGYSVRDANNPEGDIEIAITGLRPGEELYEELLIAGGNAQGTPHPKIMRADEPSLSSVELTGLLGQLRQAVDAGDGAAAREVLMGVTEGDITVSRILPTHPPR